MRVEHVREPGRPGVDADTSHPETAREGNAQPTRRGVEPREFSPFGVEEKQKEEEEREEGGGGGEEGKMERRHVNRGPREKEKISAPVLVAGMNMI